MCPHSINSNSQISMHSHSPPASTSVPSGWFTRSWTSFNSCFTCFELSWWHQISKVNFFHLQTDGNGQRKWGCMGYKIIQWQGITSKWFGTPFFFCVPSFLHVLVNALAINGHLTNCRWYKSQCWLLDVRLRKWTVTSMVYHFQFLFSHPLTGIHVSATSLV